VARPNFLGYYIPDAEPRRIADPDVKPRIHASAVQRRETLPDYDPPNFPKEFITEP
jgi:hypothetical protein